MRNKEAFMRFIGILSAFVILALPAVAETPVATIAVTGEGRVEASPDMATLSLGVVTEGRTAAEALDANTDAVAAMIARLKSAGIEDRDLQTSGLSLGPRYNYSSSSGESPTITGYSAQNMVTVRIRAIDTVGAVLDGAVSDGANTLNGLTFGMQDSEALLDEARRLAVADAARKAGLYAEAAGVTLGRVISISEPGGVQPPMPMIMAEAAFAKGGDVPVATGEVNLSAAVSIIYEIAE